MTEHAFILSPKNWLGEGKIQLSMSDEELTYFTRWSMGAKSEEGEIEATQEVQIGGMSDVMHNQFVVSDLTASRFTIELENAALGTIIGKGIIKGDIIAWEFENPEMGFEGFEFYERKEDGSYEMRAEYTTDDQLRTTIRGRIWERK